MKYGWHKCDIRKIILEREINQRGVKKEVKLSQVRRIPKPPSVMDFDLSG